MAHPHVGGQRSVGAIPFVFEAPTERRPPHNVPFVASNGVLNPILQNKKSIGDCGWVSCFAMEVCWLGVLLLFSSRHAPPRFSTPPETGSSLLCVAWPRACSC